MPTHPAVLASRPDAVDPGRVQQELYIKTAHHLPIETVGLSLVLLTEHGFAEEVVGSGNLLEYAVTESGRSILGSTRDRHDETISHMLQRYMPIQSRSIRRLWRTMFERTIGFVLEASAEQLVGQLITGGHVQVDHRAIDVAVTRATARQDLAASLAVDPSRLKKAVAAFFRENSTSTAALKVELANDYFVLIALGTLHSQRRIPEIVLRDIVLCPDTNILVEILDRRSHHRKAVKRLMASSRGLGIKFLITSQVLRELSTHFRASKVTRHRPDFRNLLMDENHVLTVDDLREHLGRQGDLLWENITLEVIPGLDLWFKDNEANPDVVALARRLQAKWLRSHRKPKSWTLAITDALHLYWIMRRRETSPDRIWLLTLDESLPGLYSTDDFFASPAVALDAIMHWHLAIQSNPQVISDYAGSYEVLVRERLWAPVLDGIFEEHDLIQMARTVQAAVQPGAKRMRDLGARLEAKAIQLNLGRPEDRNQFVTLIDLPEPLSDQAQATVTESEDRARQAAQRAESAEESAKVIEEAVAAKQREINKEAETARALQDEIGQLSVENDHLRQRVRTLANVLSVMFLIGSSTAIAALAVFAGTLLAVVAAGVTVVGVIAIPITGFLVQRFTAPQNESS